MRLLHLRAHIHQIWLDVPVRYWSILYKCTQIWPNPSALAANDDMSLANNANFLRLGGSSSSWPQHSATISVQGQWTCKDSIPLMRQREEHASENRRSGRRRTMSHAKQAEHFHWGWWHHGRATKTKQVDRCEVQNIKKRRVKQRGLRFCQVAGRESPWPWIVTTIVPVVSLIACRTSASLQEGQVGTAVSNT